MAQKGRNILKGTFVTGYKPTESDFSDVFDSAASLIDDNLLLTLKEGTKNTTFNRTFQAGSQIVAVEGVKVSGTPVIKIGFGSGGSDILEETEIDSDFYQNYVINCIEATTIFVTISGGSLKINFKYHANNF